jgi:putative tryptophan/tyrosine transport system substrate-binding protein
MCPKTSNVYGHPRRSRGRCHETRLCFHTVACMITLACASLVGSLAAEAQPLVTVPRIGAIFTDGMPRPSCSNRYFLHGLQELGYVEGRNIIIEWRCAEGRHDRARAFAVELVQLGVDILVTSSQASSEAAKAATSTIPIVFGAGGDPVADGLVASLARSSGNVTGVAYRRKHLVTCCTCHEALHRERPGRRHVPT